MLKSNAKNLLTTLAPFTLLTSEQLSDFIKTITVQKEPADKLLFTQGKSEVNYLYIIETGALEVFFENENGRQLHDVLGEGDTFGGISILCNHSFAVRTVRTIENTTFFIIPREQFKKTAEANERFSDFFTRAFGKRMVDKSYWEAVSRPNAKTPETSISVYNQKVSDICERSFARCYAHESIRGAAGIMNSRKHSSIFVCDDSDNVIGIVTDRDFREKVVAEAYDVNLPVGGIMSSPLFTISEQALVFEAILKMIQHNIKHLAVIDEQRHVIGVTNNEQLILSQGHSLVSLIRQIRQAKNFEEISSNQSRLPQIVKGLLDNGARTQNINRFITSVSDNILEKLIGMALDELGPPPVDFAFLILGSEGRREQTLKTDQDNAILFADVPAKKLKSVQNYFLELASKICSRLDACGYQFCNGDIMAQNPKWCQPLSAWKNYFKKWVITPQPKAVMHSTIFFDFRGAYGSQVLIDQLQSNLKNLLQERQAHLFFYHLAQNCLKIRPPIGFFRNFVVESQGEHRNAFDLKKAMTPIVDFARIYALENNATATNTVERLHEMAERGIITSEHSEEIIQAYNYLMRMRLSRHIAAILDEGEKPDNYINPKKLNKIEQKLLKEIFALTEDLQQKLSIHFTGI